MRADIGLFFSALMAIAIVGLLVRNGGNTAKVVSSFGNAISEDFGTVITGNPQFYAQSHNPT